jgi:hypothetical protein
MTTLRVTGPITGGAHGWPMSASLVDFTAIGYVEEEFFLEGEAPLYRARDEHLRFDGRWEVDATGVLPFKTRIVVRRPADPARFNGTVVLVWSNVSMGCDMVAHDTPEITDEGFAVVIVSAQAVGVHGFSGPHPLGLTVWDAERYGSLHIPSDDASYGIFSAAAAAVGPTRDTSAVDPLNGLTVERIIATGASQGAARLHTYWNAIHPLEKIFDAFLLEVHFGWSTPVLSGTDGRPAGLADVVAAFQPVTFLRDDADTPMLIVNTETEALTFFPVRRPDTDLFRFWEAAGATHAPLPGMHDVLGKIQRDWGSVPVAPPAGTGTALNTMDTRPLRDAALHHMQRWLSKGIPPPSLPPIEIGGQPPTIQRDEHAIALGGIRMPQVAVPLATLRGAGDSNHPLRELSGSCEPFTASTLQGMYASRSHYLHQIEEAAAAAKSAGFLLERDAIRIRQDAEQSAAVIPDRSQRQPAAPIAAGEPVKP